jgi:hypothetical protein
VTRVGKQSRHPPDSLARLEGTYGATFLLRSYRGREAVVLHSCPTEKLSVSFDPSLAATVRAAAADEGVSVSMWLAGSAEVKARRRHLREALNAVAGDHGALSDADVDRIIADARAGSTVVVGGGAA